MSRRGAPLSLLVAAALIPGAGRASPADARISPRGLDFIETQVRALVPSHLDLDPITLTLSADACSEGPITFTQEDTHLDITLESFTLTPRAGVLRVDATVSLSGTGQGSFERVYGCFGRETCGESVSFQHAHFTIDLAASVDAQGRPHVTITAPVIDLAPENVALALSDCPEAGLVNGIYGFIEKYALELASGVAQNLIGQQVGPLVENVLASYMTFSGTEAFVKYRAALTGVTISTAGVTLAADVDLASVFPTASCLGGATDPGEPHAVPGAVPDLSAGTPTDLAVAVNLGVIADAIYHVWSQGLMCVTPDTLAALKIDLSALDQLGTILPGFPDGTKWTLEANVGTPPAVEGSPADAAKLAVHARQVGLDIVATLPDHTARSLHVDLDASITASVVMDPADNALALEIDAVKIDRMSVIDHLGLGAAGADLAHVQSELETSILPKALGQIGKIPVTGPVFGGIANAYVILRELRTTAAYLMVKADLFMAPAADHNPPTTLVLDKPAGTVKPGDARLVFGGTDAEDPTELLAYRVIVDGKAADPTFVRSLMVGAVGKSGVVHVEVHAIDLAGNQDPTGARADIDVDGVPPELTLLDDLRGAVENLAPVFTFRATDDRTAASAIAVHLRVAPAGQTDAVMDADLAPGATRATLTGLVSGTSYDAVLTVRDQAGNETVATMSFDVASGASGGGSGCAVGGSGATAAVTALLVGAGAVLAAMARRRRRDRA